MFGSDPNVVFVSDPVTFLTYLRDLQPTYIGVITQLLSTMDIPAPKFNSEFISETWWDWKAILSYWEDLGR